MLVDMWKCQGQWTNRQRPCCKYLRDASKLRSAFSSYNVVKMLIGSLAKMSVVFSSGTSAFLL